MASAQQRSGTRGRPPPKRWVFTCSGSRGASTAHSSSEMRNPVVVRLLGVRVRVRLVGCSDVFIPDSILDVHFVNPTPVHCGVGKVYNGGHCYVMCRHRSRVRRSGPCRLLAPPKWVYL